MRSAVRSMAWLAALLAGAALTGCEREAVAVPLDVLVAEQEAFDGRRVTTAGVLREFDAPFHVWIEDEALHRVELVPPEPFAGRAGEHVEVTGRFSYAPDRGRVIEVELP